VLPVIKLAPLITPAPTAVRVTVVPLSAPPTVIGPATVSVKLRVPPVALMAPLVIIPPAQYL